MSIQLVVCAARSRFGKKGGIRVGSESERLGNQRMFFEVIGRECRSVDLNLKSDDVIDVINLFANDVMLAFELTESHFTELAYVLSTDLYIPCLDSNEKFYLDFPIQSEGKSVTWKLCDMNSLKEWVDSIKAFNSGQELYDREKIARLIEDYEHAIQLAEKERCVVNFSY